MTTTPTGTRRDARGTRTLWLRNDGSCEWLTGRGAHYERGQFCGVENEIATLYVEEKRYDCRVLERGYNRMLVQILPREEPGACSD